MAGFVYFIPGAVAASRKTLEEAGLWPVLKSTEVVHRQVYDGPDGANGICVMGAGGTAELCTYEAVKQTWEKKIAGTGAGTEREPEPAPAPDIWIGYWNDKPPVENELRRKVQLAGHKVELRDGEKWLVPVARRFPNGTTLPQSLKLGANGEMVREPLPQYAAFGGRVERFWDDIQRQNGWIEGEADFTEAQQWQLAAEAMGLNYHIGADEINALGLFNQQNLTEILAAVIDWQTVRRVIAAIAEANKKKDDAATDAGPLSSSGVTED